LPAALQRLSTAAGRTLQLAERAGDRYLEISPDPQPAGQGRSLSGQRLRYEQPLALEPLLQQLVQTRRDARLSLSGIHDLTSTLQRESAATAPALRDTLRQLSRTGSNAEQTSSEAQQLLRTSQPARLHTLEDIQTLTGSSDRLLRNLIGLFDTNSDDAHTKPERPSAAIDR
jgi:ABC-type transporter Mla subunit MlaD